MTSYVQLTLKEYDELKEVQKEATTIVEQTNTNLKQKLDEANSKIAELEAENRRYAIGGARERTSNPDQEMPPKPIDWHAVSDVVEELMTPIHTRAAAMMGRKRWTKEDLEYMNFYATQHYTIMNAALALDRTAASIKTQAARMGLSCKKGILSEANNERTNTRRKA